MNIKEVIKASKDLGEWAHIATVSGSGTPYVTPVHPCWEGETLWIMVGVNSVKSKNIADSPSVSLHWQVSEETSFDSLIICSICMEKNKYLISVKSQKLCDYFINEK